MIKRKRVRRQATKAGPATMLFSPPIEAEQSPDIILAGLLTYASSAWDNLPRVRTPVVFNYLSQPSALTVTG